MKPIIIKSLGLGMLTGAALLLSSSGASAQAPDVLVEVHGVQVTNSPTAPSISIDVYLSGSLNYFTQAALNPSLGLQNVDIAYDVDFGTTGSQAPATTSPILATSYAPTTVPNATSLIIPSNLSGAMPAGYDSRFKMNVQRVLTSNQIGLTGAPLKVLTLVVTYPAGTVIGTPSVGATIQLRTITGGFGSKWSDFLGNVGQPIGPSSSQAQPLPVTLTDFSALKASDGVRSQLNWTTLTETGSAYFEVERSATNEAGSFSSIGVKVAAAGTSTSKLTYQSYDRAPLAGANWYRLKIADLSGRIGYSDAKLVRFDGKGVGETVSFGPNPLTRSNASQSVLKVSVTGDQTLSYSISDASGKLVGGGNIEVVKGTDSYGIAGMDALSAGTYYLNAKGATINTTLKISKID